MKEASGIYLLRNTVNGKVYVGQSIHMRRRWHEHKKSAKRGDKSHLYDAMRKYGPQAFELIVLEECAPEEFDAREAHWMEVYDCRNPDAGYNNMPAGQRGRVMDEQTRRALSEANRGRRQSLETIEKLRAASSGRRHSAETRAKISAGNKGKRVSAEAVEKLAQALRERWANLSPEERETHAAARRGYRHSDEARARMSAARKGKPKSEEARKNMAEAQRNAPPEVQAKRSAATRAANLVRWAKYREEKARMECSA